MLVTIATTNENNKTAGIDDKNAVWEQTPYFLQLNFCFPALSCSARLVSVTPSVRPCAFVRYVQCLLKLK